MLEFSIAGLTNSDANMLHDVSDVIQTSRLDPFAVCKSPASVGEPKEGTMKTLRTSFAVALIFSGAALLFGQIPAGADFLAEASPSYMEPVRSDWEAPMKVADLR